MTHGEEVSKAEILCTAMRKMQQRVALLTSTVRTAEKQPGVTSSLQLFLAVPRMELIRAGCCVPPAALWAGQELRMVMRTRGSLCDLSI